MCTDVKVASASSKPARQETSTAMDESVKEGFRVEKSDVGLLKRLQVISEYCQEATSPGDMNLYLVITEIEQLTLACIELLDRNSNGS